MKKNVIEIASGAENRKPRLHPIQWLICLLIAVILWLAVVNITGISGAELLHS